MAITDMPERFTLGEVDVALEVRRIRFMHQSRMKDEISNIVYDPRGGMGQKLQLGRLEEIVIYSGTKSLRLKGPHEDPDLDNTWRTINMGNGTNPYTELPDYDDDEYAEKLIPTLVRRIIKHNRFIAQDDNFGKLFSEYLPKEEQAEEDPTDSQAEAQEAKTEEEAKLEEDGSTSEHSSTLESVHK